MSKGLIDQEFSPREAIERLLARWWVVLILTIVGGMIGWIFHFFQPAIYEASASITINFYFEKRELTQYESDTAFNAVGAILYSTWVNDAILAEAQNHGLSMQDIKRIQENTSIEAMESIWELHVRDRDPKVAAEYANLWATISEKTMNDALKHALLADQLQNLIDRLQNCLPSNPPVQEPLPALDECQSYSLDEIKSRLQNWAIEMADEQRLSQGVLPITTITLNRLATVPEEPVLFNQASLILAGACVGFFVSLWAASWYKIQRRD
jgi:capsular polysaccharide biosynthesis protein